MSNITQARQALVTRILEGDGKASRAQRRAAFDNAGLAKPLSTLIDKVAKHACQVADEDISAARASGLSEDQIFELVACAAVGQATRQYETAIDYIVTVLRETNWVLTGPRGAAKVLGLHANTLRSRMKKLGITRPAH